MTSSETSSALDRYRDNAEVLRRRFDGLSTMDVLSPVLSHLPTSAARVLDIGAGSGRDAVWLAAQGHSVVAVEPVRQMFQGVEGGSGITWVESQLPELAGLEGYDHAFDLILVSAVWHHIPPAAREGALGRMASLSRDGATLLMSLRHGPDADGRLIHFSEPVQTIAAAQAFGMTLVDQISVPSVQAMNAAAGVHWTWLVFQLGEGVRRE